MNHKHKTWFVAGLVILGAGCTVVASRLTPRVQLGNPLGSPNIRIQVAGRPTDGQAMLPPGVNPTPTPDAPASGPSNIESELAIKPVTKHASEILRSEDYPQEEYFALATTPNDPFANQWPLSTIDTFNGWDITTGTDDITIAVIDTGFGLQHEELADRWHVNGGEYGVTTNGGRCWTGIPADKATNNCDDDNNGYTDDWRGWDFFWNDNNPNAGSVTPGGTAVGHGTQVAAFAAASANNNKGLAGMNWRAKIMPLQVLSDNGNGITNDVVAAIEYAARQGADVINLSLGTTHPDAALLAAVRFATSRNVTVVVASGNCGLEPSTTCNVSAEPGNITYPALYDEVIAVGALTQSDTRAGFSSYGSALDVMAPGASLPFTAGWSLGNTVSLYSTGVSGTSFASPIVAGLAALVRGIDPSLSPKDVRAILTDSSDRVAGMNNQAWNNQYGFGKVNAYKAVRLTQVRSTAIKSGPAPSNSKRSPIVSLSAGTVPDQPVGIITELIGTCASYMGDSCSLEFISQTTEEIHRLPAQKTDSSGTTGWRFTPADADLSPGAWTVRAHGNSLTSESTTLYIQ